MNPKIKRYSFTGGLILMGLNLIAMSPLLFYYLTDSNRWAEELMVGVINLPTYFILDPSSEGGMVAWTITSGLIQYFILGALVGALIGWVKQSRRKSRS